MRYLAPFFFISLVTSSTVLADVLDALAEKNSIAGHFIQRVISPDEVVLESAKGQFRVLRPDYVWWQIDAPERQLLIAAGDKLTQIDWDLEVIVERDITEETRSVLHWLLAPRSVLENAFEIEMSDAEALLTPVAKGAGFLSMSISRVGEDVWTLRITDLGRQVIEISLIENPDILLDVTAFDAPETTF
jgi:hypothetical protein